ncbi:hypothetical protein BG006_003449 [Podila minutissima]|uniref:Epoxide hydrolase n=1 Tax=Podila minutissima TaxID=64525 RepID=A0A9P5SMC7_9FUNG|nr:hypothetical protein BG006_003449 [Podila minutissima]
MASPLQRSFKAVFFDIGGVVVGSPFQGIADYEKKHNLPVNYINVAITAAGSKGPFQQLERGEIDLWSFYDAFSKQLSDPSNVDAYAQYAQLRGKNFEKSTFKAPAIDGRALFIQMMGKASLADPVVVKAIASLRQAGYTVAALTNNFNYPTNERGRQEQELILSTTAQSLGAIGPSTTNIKGHSGNGVLVMGQDQLKTLFDHFIESAILGLRKPDPAIYKKACELVGVQPSEVVFLDDIGLNLKSAQGVGMTTIRVELGRSEKAIEELGRVLGVQLASKL